MTMSSPAQLPTRLPTEDAHRPLRGFLFEGAANPTAGRAYVLPWRSRSAARPSFAGSAIELATSLSGLALVLFMFMHLGLLSSVMIGAQSMNDLASFLERYYLLQVGAVALVAVLAVHVIATGRRAPTNFREQLAFARQMRRAWHFDTWTWALQLFTAGVLVVLAAVHLWVILTDLPIQAAKSADRVSSFYLWLYIPFVLAAEAHISLGLYRMSVKWGLLKRSRAHVVVGVWTPAVLGLGFAILAALYGLGGGS